MLSLFRTNQAYAGFFLLFYALLLQLPALLGGVEPRVTYDGGYLGQWLMNWIGERRWLALLLPVLLIFIQSLQANALVTRHRLSRTVTQFPGLFLVLVWAAVPAFSWAHPVQVANVALLFGLLSLGRLYKREVAAVPLFNAGAWLGIASLFLPQYLLFLPAFFIAVGVLRRPDLRSLLQLLTGLLLLYFLMGGWLYFRGLLPVFLAAQLESWGWLALSAIELPAMISLGVLGGVLLVLLLAYGGLTRLLNIEGSKGVNIQYWLLLSTPLLLLLAGGTGADFAQVVTVPLGILLGLAFIQLSPERANLFHLLLVFGAILPELLRLLNPVSS